MTATGTSLDRVTLISTLYPPLNIGGAELVVRSLAESLVATGCECLVVTLSDSAQMISEQVNGVEVVRLPLRNGYWPFGRDEPTATARLRWHSRDAWNHGMAADVDDLLAKFRPDLVNTHNLSGFSIAVWRAIERRSIPLVHTLHDQYLLCPRTTMFRDGSVCDRPCTGCRLLTLPRRTQRDRPSLVTGPSRFIIDRHLEYGWFRDTETRVIPNGIPPRESSHVGPHRDGRFRFGFLGRIAETKGIVQLLSAFSALGTTDAQLLIAGIGEPALERMLRDETRNRPDVSWLGFVDPADLLEQVDVLVVPSLWEETSGLVVMEAMQAGVPVLGSNRGGIPELISPGETGWLFEPTDPAGFVKRLMGCVAARDELAHMSARCRAAAARFTIDRSVDGYLSAYRAVVGG